MRKYNGQGKEDDGLIKVIKVLTFQNLPPFENYETAVVNTANISAEDKKMIAAIRYYDNLYLSNNADILSFGANGDKAFDALSTELSSGNPSVVTTGNNVYNVSRLLRKSSDPNTFIIEGYDVNGGEDVKIVL